ncbi:hypothetical protein [Candidatus Rhabdochlamydia porcellionis]|jgi:hypothetical protein|uniref:Uncharacterized protein n=1 Tax=Candidatus Rhabdochlamydia porcellionis TaxID=225148 RepID=A0ABX8YYH5_9BACT|nr:hypothetical protein [Candidatus Rhabdochlamydia porcellionis]QZA58366.1 hypothetical protein RHAB15C_0000239 [Candidatus Rhabdochlamydia porcellionis]
MHIVRSITSFCAPDPISFNQNLGNRCQIFCSKSPSPNILSRLIVGVIIKDVIRISDIAIHIIIGLVKLTICTIKLPYSIPARLWGSIPSYEIGKEGLAHLGFSGFYFADIFISLANMINRYPKDLIEKVENCFSRFLSSKEEVHKTQLEGPQIAPCPKPETNLDESTFTTQKVDTDSDTSFEEESSQSQQEDPLYQALVECGTDPEKSKILATNYSSKYPKSFRHSINSIVSEY